MKKPALHWQILIGMILGLLMSDVSWGKMFIQNWINPFGIIFTNPLKLIAIPLILAPIITRDAMVSMVVAK